MTTGTTTGSLDILSCGTGLPGEAIAACAGADHVFASKGLLARLGTKAGCAFGRHVVAARAAQDAQAAIDLALQGQRVAVLASGDALYNGMGATVAAALEKRFPGRDAIPFPVRFHPGITAFQDLCHRLGIPWSGARLFSAHWTKPPLREMLEARLAIVYGGSTWPASAIAAGLLALHPASAARACVLAEDLGLPTQSILAGTLAEAAARATGPNAILVLRPEGAAPLPLALGLADGQYAFEAHLITAPEVRAVALSRLRLPSFGVLWDLGAGSGSVGLEAAALRPQLDVVAVERHPSRCAMIRRNAEALGVANHRLVEADIRQFLDDGGQAKPDRVFVGGGGEDLAAIVEACVRRLAPGGLLVAPAVTLESVARLSTLLPDLSLGCLSLDVAVSRPLGSRWHQLFPRRRIHLFTFAAAADGPGNPPPDTI